MEPALGASHMLYDDVSLCLPLGCLGLGSELGLGCREVREHKETVGKKEFVFLLSLPRILLLQFPYCPSCDHVPSCPGSLHTASLPQTTVRHTLSHTMVKTLTKSNLGEEMAHLT